MKRQLNFVEESDVNICGVWALGDYLLLSTKPAIDGDVTIVYETFWGEKEGQTLTRTVNNPTYLQLWEIASELISESGDEQHVFIEDFMYNEERNVFELVTGS